MSATWNKLFEKEKLSILGLMSGTSCDALDIAHVEIMGQGIGTHFQFLSGMSIPYSPAQRNTIFELIGKPQHTLKSLSQFNFYLAKIWAVMVQNFLNAKNLKPRDIDVIGSHGQTIWHQPNPEAFGHEMIASTWQAGDPSVLANLLQIPVIGDFRPADVAIGGQGAPLIPYFDWIHFSRFNKNVLAVNIGGISNITFIPRDGHFEKVIAFDSGPGNMLIDQAAKELFAVNYDKDGALASNGKTDPEFIQFIEKIDDFSRSVPPKSSGREYYNLSFLRKIIDFGFSRSLTGNDILAGLTSYTAKIIHSNYKMFIDPLSKVDVVAVGGGGAKNPVLMNELQKFFLEIPVHPVSTFDLNEEFKEAIGFAVLANETLHICTSNVPQVTGASRSVILGKICPVFRVS